MAKNDEVKAAPYQLIRRYWDNRMAHEKGAVLDFLPNQAPRGSIKLTAREAKALRGRAVEAALDPVENELTDLRLKVAKLTELIAPDDDDKIPAKN